MKFSVVIPTHNRLDLLRDAIETVRRQDYVNWELVVFDNASSDDIGGHVASLSDSRVRYERSDEFLPVTSSWNRAIDLATGDYVVFLGDDDGLAPRYFSRVGPIIGEFRSPEIVYCAIYQFMHPGVAPLDRRGFVSDLRNGFFFVGRDTPFLMSAEQARKAVTGSIGLRRNFTFNIQAFAFSKEFLTRLREDGPVFRSPFPDYYLANVALAKSRSTVVVPSPMSIAGVSQASFGFTLFNNLEERGARILNSQLAADPLFRDVERFLLPGPMYNSNYVLTMEHVARYLPDFAGRGVAYGKYRRLQILELLIAGKGWLPPTVGGKLFWPKLSPLESLWAVAVAVPLLAARVFSLEEQVVRVLRRLAGPYDFHPTPVILDRGNFSRLIRIFDAIEKGSF